MARKPNRTEAERAQEAYEVAARKVDRKRAQVERLKADLAERESELQGLLEVENWLGSHPLVKTEE